MSRLIARRRSRIHGNGVFATAHIPADTRVCFYQGERITHDQADETYGDTLPDEPWLSRPRALAPRAAAEVAGA